MVAHRTLTPFVRVRILHPLPRKTGQILRKWPVFPYFGSFLRGLSLFWPVFGAKMDEYFLLKNVDPLFDPKTFSGAPPGGLPGRENLKFFPGSEVSANGRPEVFSGPSASAPKRRGAMIPSKRSVNILFSAVQPIFYCGQAFAAGGTSRGPVCVSASPSSVPVPVRARRNSSIREELSFFIRSETWP